MKKLYKTVRLFIGLRFGRQNYRSIALTLSMCILGFVNTEAQEIKINKNSELLIGFKISTGYSFLEDSFVTFNEVNTSNNDLAYNLRQYKALIFDYDLECLVNVYNKHWLIGGVGYNQYSHIHQQGTARGKFDYRVNSNYFSVKVGHNYRLFQLDLIDIAISNIFQVDMLSPWSYIGNRKEYNLSYNFVLELAYQCSDKIKLFIPIFYKHAITRYNEEKFNRNYYPYSYGLGIGMRYKMSY